MLMYQKSMFDPYYCIKAFFSLENFGEIASISSFTCTYNGVEKHVTCKCFENVTSRAKTNVVATVHPLMMKTVFMTAPECLFVKPQSHTVTAVL